VGVVIVGVRDGMIVVEEGSIVGCSTEGEDEGGIVIAGELVCVVIGA
jgi:hypothetical protein